MEPNFLQGLLQALLTGAQHSYGQVKDDLGSLVQGRYNPGTATRMADVAGELPLGKLLSSITSALNPQLAKIMVPGGTRYHGSPTRGNAPFDPKKANPASLVGPADYWSGTSQLGNEYALGSTVDAAALQAAGKYAPSVQKMAMKPHNALDLNQAIPQADIDAIVKALQGTDFPEKVGKHGAIPSSGQQSNVIAQIQSALAPEASPGQQAWDLLNSMMGPEKANKLLGNAGFQSIAYTGGQKMGDMAHEVNAILDPSILANYFQSQQSNP